jgi:hypothetical protein
MSRGSDSLEKNNYEGNGWSKYQIMVLQQLDDHNKVLQNLNKELVEVKQSMAVSETELKMWRAQTMLSIEKLTEDVDEILYDEGGLNYKLRALEKTSEIEEQVSVKTKAMWAVYGAIIAFLINFGLRLFEIFSKSL